MVHFLTYDTRPNVLWLNAAPSDHWLSCLTIDSSTSLRVLHGGQGFTRDANHVMRQSLCWVSHLCIANTAFWT